MPDATASRPNIVLLMLDDMGYSDIGCFGAEIATPNLDRLGRNGLRFSQFYNAARCCPSRACILTGLYPHQSGIGGMVNRGPTPAYQGFLNDRCVTLAEVLRPHGYATLMAGKWHVGGPYRVAHGDGWDAAGTPGFPIPTQRGFQRFYGTLTGAGSYFNPPTLMQQDRFIDPPGAATGDYYYTDALGEQASDMIRQTPAEQPLFLYFTPTAPHWPLHAKPADIATYRDRYRDGWDALRQQRYDRLLAEGLVQPQWGMSPRDEGSHPWSETAHPDWEAERMAVYAAQVDNLDQNVGRVIAALEDTGRYENTLFIFLSDNGGCAEFLKEDGDPHAWPGHYAQPTGDGRRTIVGNNPDRQPGGADTFMSYDLPWANASNTPFRKFKCWTHEGGISTPCFMHWPRVIRPGITHEVAHIVDLMATVCELTGAPYPAELAGQAILPTAGHSLAPLLRGESWTRPAPVYWEHQGCGALRDGDWKLVRGYGTSRRWELYHIAHDRTELHDLAGAEPDRLAAMTTTWLNWAQDVGVHNP